PSFRWQSGDWEIIFPAYSRARPSRCLSVHFSGMRSIAYHKWLGRVNRATIGRWTLSPATPARADAWGYLGYTREHAFALDYSVDRRPGKCPDHAGAVRPPDARHRHLRCARRHAALYR